MKLTDAVRADIDNAVLCWLATVDAEGAPNVTPKEIFATHGEAMLVIADIQSAGSVRNIGLNPNVCVSFVDIFRQRGFKITGTARIVASEAEEFTALSADLVRLAAPDFQVRNVIAVEIERIQRMRAPSYVFFPERTEEDLMAAAYRTYGVRPL